MTSTIPTLYKEHSEKTPNHVRGRVVVCRSKNKSVVFRIILFFRRPPGPIRRLPLGFLGGQEVVQDLDNVLEAAQPSTKLFLNTSLVVTKLGVEVLAVGSCAHGGAENGLDHEAVVLAEGVAVGRAERDADLLSGVGQVLAKGLGGEVEGAISLSVYKTSDDSLGEDIPVQPDETFCRGVLLGSELVTDEVLEGLRVDGSSELTVTNFL